MTKRTNRVVWGLVVLAAIPAGVGAVSFLRPSSETQQKALFDAISKGDARAVQSLLRRGAKANVRNPFDNFTPLFAAINAKRPGIVQLLLAHGAKLKDDEGCTPLCYAAIWGNAATVKLLLAHGEKVDRPETRTGTTPLFGAAQWSGTLVPDKEKTAIVDTLLAAGADPNARDQRNGKTALMWAAYHRQTAMVRSLLLHGASINVKDKYGMTALMLAAVKGSPSVVELLLAHGANKNLRDKPDRFHKSGRTALDIARGYHPELVPLFKQTKSPASTR
jgi:uncharacterized protein